MNKDLAEVTRILVSTETTLRKIENIIYLTMPTGFEDRDLKIAEEAIQKDSLKKAVELALSSDFGFSIYTRLDKINERADELLEDMYTKAGGDTGKMRSVDKVIEKYLIGIGENWNDYRKKIMQNRKIEDSDAATKEDGKVVTESEPSAGDYTFAGNTVVVNKSNEKNINEAALKDYFIASFKGMGNNINYFDYLIEDIKKIQNAKDAARAALVIYNSDKMSKARKPNNFNQWYKLFCGMTGCKHSRNYKKSNLDTAQMKTRLYYL